MQSITLNSNLYPRRLLAIFPHPDDETFGPGGTLARYAREGVSVHYACATRGEVGSVDDNLLEPYIHLPEEQRIGTLRENELRCAATTLGLAGLHLLGYRDSGMHNTEDNRHPRAFINADPQHVTAELVGLIRRIQPQVIITFDPFGGYGHPDHIFAHQRTMEAFTAAGNPTRYPEAGEPYAPQKLYWLAFPKRILKIALRVMPLFRRDPTKFGRNKDVNLREIAEQHDYPINTRIDIWPYFAIREKAARCHTSQMGTDTFWSRLPRPLRRWIAGYETFTRVEPPTTSRRVIEHDLFAGVDPLPMPETTSADTTWGT